MQLVFLAAVVLFVLFFFLQLHDLESQSSRKLLERRKPKTLSLLAKISARQRHKFDGSKDREEDEDEVRRGQVEWKMLEVSHRSFGSL